MAGYHQNKYPRFTLKETVKVKVEKDIIEAIVARTFLDEINDEWLYKIEGLSGWIPENNLEKLESVI